jgi:hypothetical protein
MTFLPGRQQINFLKNNSADNELGLSSGMKNFSLAENKLVTKINNIYIFSRTTEQPVFSHTQL